MTDYLLVHGLGQGAWCWGKVWGLMTAPDEHPPRLYAHRKVGKVYPMDLPGHGADLAGDTSAVLVDECIQSILGTWERQNLRDVVVVAHGFAASLVLQAVPQLPSPPKRIVLVAGVIPAAGKSPASELPLTARCWFRPLTIASRVFGKELTLPSGFVARSLCNGMDTMEIVQSLGFFGALPIQVMQSKTAIPEEVPCPLSYVVLTGDRLFPPAKQHRMASRLPNSDVIELASCHQAPLANPQEVATLLQSYA